MKYETLRLCLFVNGGIDEIRIVFFFFSSLLPIILMSSSNTSTRLTPQGGRSSNNKTTNMEDKHHPQHFPSDRQNYRNPRVQKQKNKKKHTLYAKTENGSQTNAKNTKHHSYSETCTNSKNMPITLHYPVQLKTWRNIRLIQNEQQCQLIQFYNNNITSVKIYMKLKIGEQKIQQHRG